MTMDNSMGIAGEAGQILAQPSYAPPIARRAGSSLNKSSTVSKPFEQSGQPANESTIVVAHFREDRRRTRGAKLMSTNAKAVMENVRRYRLIASLYRRTAAFRPLQSCSLLRQADEWEQLAMTELEAYFNLRDREVDDMQPAFPLHAAARWDMVAAA
jgi:hypothetical protein